MPATSRPLRSAGRGPAAAPGSLPRRAPPPRALASPPPPRHRLGRPGPAAPAPWRGAAGAERPAAPSDDAAPADAASKPFAWARAWYPVTALDCLDAARPAAFTVLGTDLAVWRDAGGAWRAFRDRCPHRAAPLSEGALHPASGDLVCAYHGFAFDGAGACTAIPQAEPGRAHATATASRRACALAYPTRAARGLLFVWMEAEDAGGAVAARAAAAPLPLDGLPAADAAGAPWFEVAPWYVRELEVDYLPLLENSADPSHVHFAHAGALGKVERAGPLAVREVASDSAARGGPDEIRLVCDDPRKATFSDLRLRPPCALWAASENAPGGHLALLYFVVPIAPGRSRLMSLPLSTNAAFRLPARLFHAAPWLRHLNNHAVSAQDAALLHRQGAALAAPDFAARGWRRGFYLPTKADGGVAALRRWLEAAEGGGVRYGPSIDPAPRREALPGAARERLFDNWAQHTRSCPSCVRALGRVRAARAVVTAGLAALALAAAHAAGRGAAARVWAALAAGALALAAARAALGRLERAFLKTEWRHADNRSLLAGLAAVARRAAPAAPKAI